MVSRQAAQDLFLRNEKARRRVLTGAAVVGEGEGDVVDWLPSLVVEMLPDERLRVSSSVCSRLTLAWEYGVQDVSRISTNLEDDIVAFGSQR